MSCQSASEHILKCELIKRKWIPKDDTTQTLFHSHFIHLFLCSLPYLKSFIFFFFFPHILSYFFFPFQLIYGSNIQGNQECVCHQHGKKRLSYLTLLPVCVDIVSQSQCTYVSLNNVMAISHCVLMDQKGSSAQCI